MKTMKNWRLAFMKKSGTVLIIHFEKEIDQFSIKYGKYIRLKDAESE